MSPRTPRRQARAHVDRRQRATASPRDASAASDRRTPGAFWIALGAAALCLVFTIDDRYAGAIPDGRQMSWTAVAIAETGQIGQARARDFTWARTGGDGVSRYGL